VTELKTVFRDRRADVLMALVTVVWGVHYIVVKDSMSDFEPLTFNALRFSIGVPVMLLVGLRTPSVWRVPPGLRTSVVISTLLGSLGYQILFVLGIRHTTSTNTALLAATSPTWTALLSMALGWVQVKRRLLVGIAITLSGVALVVLGRAEAGLALSHDDLIGSVMILVAAIMASFSALISKPVVDRAGSMTMAVWSYTLTAVGLVVLALPNLRTLSADDLPLKVWPNLLYSGIVSSAFGFVIWNYALRQIGPTRAATYNNFTPLVAAAAGTLILGETITPALLVGGALTLIGVVIARRNMYLRERPPLPDAAAPAPAVGR
jgi:drug/metabolite transporter (DMT)-like permease